MKGTHAIPTSFYCFVFVKMTMLFCVCYGSFAEMFMVVDILCCCFLLQFMVYRSGSGFKSCEMG